MHSISTDAEHAISRQEIRTSSRALGRQLRTGIETNLPLTSALPGRRRRGSLRSLWFGPPLEACRTEPANPSVSYLICLRTHWARGRPNPGGGEPSKEAHGVVLAERCGSTPGQHRRRRPTAWLGMWIRTSESVLEPPIWICVTISPEGGASPAAETLRVPAAWTFIWETLETGLACWAADGVSGLVTAVSGPLGGCASD